jgi:ABC-type multidrug transport system fused ATPase/permease subunit
MTQQSKSQNALACIIAGIISIMVSLRIGKRFIPQVPFLVLAGLVVITFIAAVIYLTIRKRKGSFTTETTFAFWQGVIRYFIAMDMVMFALQKVFHMQFVVPLGVLDNPFSSLDGEQLVWAFFGKFYEFTVIIACMQATGAVLLLFRRTSLLGVIVLLPIFLNILLLDWFYNLGIGVNIYITLLSIATIYLLLLEYSRLKEFFFIAKSHLPVIEFKTSFRKNAIRLSAILIPVLLMSFYHFPKTYPEIIGKYWVKSYTINNIPQDTTCHDSVLTKVFIDNSDFVLEYGNYQKRSIGSYNYKPQTRQIKVIWRYAATLHDTLYSEIAVGTTPDSKVLRGRMGKQIFKIEIKKRDEKDH